jgi:hypothetical protein
MMIGHDLRYSDSVLNTRRKISPGFECGLHTDWHRDDIFCEVAVGVWQTKIKPPNGAAWFCLPQGNVFIPHNPAVSQGHAASRTGNLRRLMSSGYVKVV